MLSRIDAETSLLEDSPSVVKELLVHTDHSVDVPVEERLIQKGKLYKFNLNQKRHEIIRDQIETGPTFQPTLVANNEPYL
jgi:hypothetical protein